MELATTQIFDAAVTAAKQSQCERALCGSVIVKYGKIIGKGFNGPAGNEAKRCHDNYRIPENNKHDITCCVHAEIRAIHDAITNSPGDLNGASLYFIRLNSLREPTGAGTPYCTICSREALDAGLAEFGLWRDDHFQMYNTQVYNDLSYQFFKDENLWNLK